MRFILNIAVRQRLIVLELNCMKALIFEQMKRSEEAMQFQKQTLFKNLTSSVAWHVLGLLHKGHSQFEEAKKAYLQAQKYDSENLNILRDLANLQVFLKDYAGH